MASVSVCSLFTHDFQIDAETCTEDFTIINLGITHRAVKRESSVSYNFDINAYPTSRTDATY